MYGFAFVYIYCTTRVSRRRRLWRWNWITPNITFILLPYTNRLNLYLSKWRRAHFYIKTTHQKSLIFSPNKTKLRKYHCVVSNYIQRYQFSMKKRSWWLISSAVSRFDSSMPLIDMETNAFVFVKQLTVSSCTANRRFTWNKFSACMIMWYSILIEACESGT